MLEVDGGRSCAPEQRAGLFERGRVPGDVERDAIRGRDADQRRAADRQPADRLSDLLGAVKVQPALLGRQPRLVDRQQRRAVELQRDEL
jgi:hypothetical protein